MSFAQDQTATLITTFLGAFCAVWALTFAVRAFATRRGIFAHRDGRRRHERATPLLGGSAFYVVIFAVTAALALVKGPDGEAYVSARFASCFLTALSLIYFMGAWDDWRELKAAPKFAVEFAAAFLVLAGEPALPGLFRELINVPTWVVVPFVAIWIVGVINAINMIDGLDGLCSGVVAISALTMAAISITTGSAPNWSNLTMIALAGGCVGFLMHNFNPARIFLGDSGSLLLGFVLAVVSLKLEVKRSLVISLSLPVFLLGLPLMDVGLAIVRRKLMARPLFKGDRSHIHHRLQQIGLSHRSAVLALWLITAYLNATAYFLAHIPPHQSIYIYATVVPSLVFCLLALYYVEKRLSYQVARYGQLFLRRRDHRVTVDKSEVTRHIRSLLSAQAGSVDSARFTVLVVDCRDFVKELAHERPGRIVEFWMGLYGCFTERLRMSDIVARVSDYKVAAVISEFGAERARQHPSLIRDLSGKVRELQANYQVFLSDNERPEGFSVLHYPENAAQIWKALAIEPADLIEAVPPLSKAV